MASRSLGTYDYVIVGAGTAGCVLANRLSADRDVNVLLIEAGGKDNYFWIRVPVGYLYTIGNPRTDWCYKTEAEEGLNGRSIGYARGKVLGGCSSINAMIHMRGQRGDYDHWAELGNRGWSWDEVLPYFKRTENYVHGADALHGTGGELRVEERRVSWEILDAWREAAAECGIPKIVEFNRGDNFGNAYFQVNQRRGVRWSATNAFLRPVLHRRNLKVMTRASALRVRVATRENIKRATGVELRSPRRWLTWKYALPKLSPRLNSVIFGMPHSSAASRQASRISQLTRRSSTRSSPPTPCSSSLRERNPPRG